MKILFADDNADTRQMFQMVFQLHGHTTRLVLNGEEAVEAAAAEVFDAIVLDVEMPVLDGLEAMQRIRRLPHGRDTPIIVFTGYARREYERQALELGANDVIYKPLLPDDLLTRIQQLQRVQRSSNGPLPPGSSA